MTRNESLTPPVSPRAFGNARSHEPPRAVADGATRSYLRLHVRTPDSGLHIEAPRCCVVAREDRIAYGTVMPRDTTGFDKYVRARMQDREFASAYKEARAEIDAIDHLMRRIDVARSRAGLSKADLARRASTPQESVRRLLTAKKSNPTLQTVVRLAQAVGLRVELVAEPGSGRRRRAAAHA